MKEIVKIIDGIHAIKLREYDDGVYTSAGFVQEYEPVDDYTGPLWINSCAALYLPLDWMDHLVNKITVSNSNQIELSNEQYKITDIDWTVAQQYDKDDMPPGTLKPVFTLSDGSKVNKLWFTPEINFN